MVFNLIIGSVVTLLIIAQVVFFFEYVGAMKSIHRSFKNLHDRDFNLHDSIEEQKERITKLYIRLDEVNILE